MQKQGEDFFGISYYSTACMIISNCSYALEMGGGGLRILTRKKINGDGDVGVFLQLARLCGTRVDVDAVYFTHDRPWKQKRYSGY